MPCGQHKSQRENAAHHHEQHQNGSAASSAKLPTSAGMPVCDILNMRYELPDGQGQTGLGRLMQGQKQTVKRISCCHTGIGRQG